MSVLEYLYLRVRHDRKVMRPCWEKWGSQQENQPHL